MRAYAQRVGSESESFLCFVAQRLGWGLSRPYATDLAYDFAIKRPDDKTWKKVQVKTSAPKRRGARSSVDLRKVGNRQYLKTDYDLMGAYCPATNRLWLIPKKSILEYRAEIIPEMTKFDKYQVHW